MITLTYDEYDRIEEICSMIKQKNEEEFLEDEERIDGKHMYPTIEQLKAVNIEDHAEDYFLYLMYWYTQRFDDLLKNDAIEYGKYKEAMKYIKAIIDDQIEFIDDEEETTTEEGAKEERKEENVADNDEPNVTA